MAPSCLWRRKLISYSRKSGQAKKTKVRHHRNLSTLPKYSPPYYFFFPKIAASAPRFLTLFLKNKCNPFPFYGKHLYVQSCAPLEDIEDTVQRNIPFPLRVGHPRASSVPDRGRNGRKLFISPPDPQAAWTQDGQDGGPRLAARLEKTQIRGSA